MTPPPIIVGYEPTAAGRDALALGRGLAGLTGAPLSLANVHPRGGEERSGALLRDAAVRLCGDDDVRLHPVAGTSLPRGLSALADELAGGLLVVGSSRRATVGRVLLGSAASRVVHGAPCAAAVAPAGYAAADGRRIAVVGVGYDASDQSRQALSQAAALASRTGAFLRIVSVREPGCGGAGNLGHDVITLAEGENLGIAADAVLVDGDAAVELGRQGVDLLLCGSRGYGLGGQVLLGGTSSRLLRGAECPVVVLARGVRRTPFFSRLDVDATQQERGTAQRA
jgi:nucleotide-binding universal stress UspA family protein